MPDYYVLVDLVTDEMAEVLLGMKKRRTNLKLEHVAKNIGETRKASYEEISYWFNKYDGQIGVGACQCRRSRRILGEDCGDLEDDKCIIVGELADAAIRTNKIRRITKEEGMEIILKAEKEGCAIKLLIWMGKTSLLVVIALPALNLPLMP